MGKSRTPRQEALRNYIIDYMLENTGRAPTLNDMIRDGVGKRTEKGAITSKSVLRYNLLRLEQMGDIGRIADGTSRNLTLPGALFTIPFNTLLEKDFDFYEVLLIDIDDFANGTLPKKMVNWLYGFDSDTKRFIYTISTRFYICNAWLPDGISRHICKRRPYEVLNELVCMEGCPDAVTDFTAVVSQQHGMRLAALGFGMGVFKHEEIHGCKPNSPYHDKPPL